MYAFLVRALLKTGITRGHPSTIFLFVGVADRGVFARTLRILNHQLQMALHQVIPGRRRKTIDRRTRAGQIC